MQNVDFYSGKIVRNFPPQFNREDPEYFAKLAKINLKEEHKTMRKASRILSLIIALCIISFTAGLAVGIKFASGSNKEIVDEQTRVAVTNIGQKVTNLIKENPVAKSGTPKNEKRLFAKEDFPYIIRVGGQFNKADSQKIAGIVSGQGHTVILSKDGTGFNVFVGPYRNQEEAQANLMKVKTYSLNNSAVIIKR
ncbi:MAG: SPOR domain-containing protein [Spirochaetes bacterium]|nr:SPOR domain-containing protein [Spirochaetota bacterium]